jgi:hypothetical protein
VGPAGVECSARRSPGHPVKVRAFFAALSTLPLPIQAAPAATRSTIAALPPEATAGTGAVLPFDEYEAENAITDGVAIGPGRAFGTLAAEASGRRAVLLSGTGRFVEFVLERPANALTVRLAIPDSADGAGLDATLGIYVEGKRIAAVQATSRYGWFYGAYPFTNRPADGNAHHFFDEPRLLLGRTLAAGTRVRLRIGEEDKAPWYVVDLADFELVPPPLAQPPGSLSLLRFGADPRGRRDSSAAFRAALAAASARGRILWIPPGQFTVNGHFTVDRVTVAGAGAWYAVLHGDRIGLYGNPAPLGSRRVVLRNFAIMGEVRERKDHDQVNGIGGAMGGGSLIENLWIQHVKAGLWFDGPMAGIRLRGLRILDTMADGLNFHRGVSDAIVENFFIRNSGDDGLAAWSGGAADHHIAFRHNTVIAPILANGIALYGGHDLAIRSNLVADSVTEGGGLHLGNRFGAIPLSGRIALTDNVIVRGGSFDPHRRFGIGALWLYALDAPIAARIAVRGLRLLDSSEDAILFLGKPISEVDIEQVRIRRAGAGAFAFRGAATVRLRGVTAAGLGAPAILACSDAPGLRDLGGNSGLDTSARRECGPFERGREAPRTIP